MKFNLKMKGRIFSRSLHVVAVFAAAAHLQGAGFEVEVPSATKDRASQIVHWTPPSDFPRVKGLVGHAGEVLPIQWEADGSATMIIPFQKGGEALVFRPQQGADSPVPAQVTVSVLENEVSVRLGPLPVLAFRTNRNQVPRADINPVAWRAGYLHPVYSPAGKVVTDDYPANHLWHHGIWTPWTKTTFRGHEVDFWNLEKKLGREDLIKLGRTWEGPVHGGFAAELAMDDVTTSPAVRVLDETWQINVYQVPGTKRPVRLFDLAVNQRAATNDPLRIEQYHYGGFAMRGAAEWNGPGDAARFMTSEGITDRLKGNETRARWVYLGGPIEGRLAGLTVLGHPGNLRSPQPVRLHPYFPYLSLVPQQLGAFSIEAGKPYEARYRFLVMDDEPRADEIEAYWQGYAEPAKVQTRRVK